MSKRWMSSGCLRAAPVGEVNADKGVIEGVSVCTVGEAKGHGVHLDEEFIAEVEKQGNASKQGLKARFGHPNMCSTALGTFLGRFKNFSVDGDQVRADLFLSNSAKDTPHGDLHSYVMGMAKDEPDMFGTSIVFTPGREYQRGDDGEKVFELDKSQPVYVECDELHACDAVDEPAANDGLFSKFSGETLAGQMTEFLDLHPQVWEAVRDNPSIFEVLSRYGNKMDEFVSKYKEYKAMAEYNCECIECGYSTQSESHCKDLECPECGGTMRRAERPGPGQQKAESEGDEQMKQEKSDAEPLEVSEELETAEPVEEVVDEVVEEPEADAEPEVEEEPEAEPEVEEEEELEQLSRDEFAAIADEFGDAVAVQVMREGGDYETALQTAYDILKAENEQLRAKVEQSGGHPTKVVAEKEKKGLFNTGK